MKLTWYGHSCFMLESGEDRIIFDPFQPGTVPGARLPEGLEADMVLSSHSHFDHCWPGGIKLSGRTPKAKIERIPCFHDDRGGALRGNNLISVVETEGLRIAHFGDLGHRLTEAQIAALGRLDVIMIPVGGYYTIDAETANETVKAFEPCTVIPMHYRGEGFGFDNIAEVGDFAALRSDCRYTGLSELETASLKAPATLIMKMKNS